MLQSLNWFLASLFPPPVHYFHQIIESASIRRTQDTTEELIRLFDQGDQPLRQDARKTNYSLPNAPFRRRPQTPLQGQTHPQNQPGQHSFFKYDNVRRKPPQAQPSPETQSSPQTQQPNSAPSRNHNARRLPSDAKTSEAQSPPQIQRTNRPLIHYEDIRQPPQTTSQRSSTRPPRPLPAGAVDARSLGASLGPNSSTRRLPPRNFNPNRSPGAGSGKRRRGTTDAARQKPPKSPRGRARTSAQRPNVFGSHEEKTRMSPEEEEYHRLKEEANQPKAVTYVPAVVGLETLSGTGPVLPAMGLGAWGQEAAVADWVEGMRTRSRLVWMSEGIRVDQVEGFRGADTDDDMQGSSSEKKKKSTTRKSDAEAAKTGSENEGPAEELLKKEFEARKIAEKLFKGEYVFDGRDETGVLGSLKRQAVRNETYLLPKDCERLAQKVGSLLPAPRS